MVHHILRLCLTCNYDTIGCGCIAKRGRHRLLRQNNEYRLNRAMPLAERIRGIYHLFILIKDGERVRRYILVEVELLIDGRFALYGPRPRL
jgi:hypothetical protein